MKIEKGKFYKMRGGGIVFCYRIDNTPLQLCEYSVIVDNPDSIVKTAHINGWITGSRCDSDFTGDIVTESNHPEDVIEEISEDFKKEYPEYFI